MEDSIWLIGMLAGGWVFLLPIVALITARRARREALRAQERCGMLSARLDSFQRTLAPSLVPSEVLGARPVPAPVPEAELILPAAPASPSTEPDPFKLPPLPAGPETSAIGGRAPEPDSSLEEKIALVWFTRIGAMALLLGIAYFFKYAVDNAWIGPLGRVALGSFAGMGMLAFGEKVRRTTRPTYVGVVLGVGLSFLYVSAYASFAFYHLVPMPLAFGAIIVITLLGGALAVHHDAEPILVLALLGGFSGPVLLSTGVDRLGALTAYLLVLTSLGYATALRKAFGASVILAMTGTVLLLLGWYGKFFDGGHGTYERLSGRTLPLLVVSVFVAQWVGVYFAVRRFRVALPRLWLLLAALSFGHLGAALLLFDHPVGLGAALAGLAALGVALLGAEDRKDLLGIPLSLAFLVLAITVGASKTPDSSVSMMGVLGILSLVYVGAFLRGQVFQASPSVDRLSLAWAGAAGVGFLVLTGLLLLDGHPREFALSVALVSLGYASLSWAVGVPSVAALAVVLSFIGLSFAAPWTQHEDWKFVGITGLWASVYFASGAYELLGRRAHPTALRLATVSAAGLGFLILAEPQVASDAWTTRAVLLALVGVADLAVGSVLLQRAQRKPATALLGQALALFAAAAACFFSGSVVTVIWAILGAVLAVLATQSEDRWWLGGAYLFFAAALVRVVAVDLPASDHLQDLFFETMGKSGALSPRAFLNGRSVALVGTALGLLVAGRATSRRARPDFASSAAIFVVGAHLLLLAGVTLEAHGLSLSTPFAPPGGASPAEFRAFVVTFQAALAAQSSRLSMVTTLVFSAYAAVLVGIGFGGRNRLHRYLGLGLFAVALGKLVLWDVWHLPRLYQMLVLILIGALLLGASFLYARFGRRLAALIREGTAVRSVMLCMAFAAALGTSTASAMEPTSIGKTFAWTRPIQGVTDQGYFTFELDPEVYRHTAEDAADLRVMGPNDTWAPFILRAKNQPSPALFHASTFVDSVILAGGGARATVDLGRAGLKHSEVQLHISGENFIRSTRVEVSTDELHFELLAEGATLFRVVSGDARAEHLSVRYPTSDARYLRVTILPGPDAEQLRIEGGQLSYLEQGDSTPPVRTLPLTWRELPPAAPEQRSLQRFLLDAQAPGVPLNELSFTVKDPEFERHVRILASREQRYWTPVGSGVLFRVPPTRGQSGSVESLAVRIPVQRSRFFKVEIENGDNAPLRMQAAHASYAPQELLFRADQAGPHQLLFGNPNASAPAYDLPSVLARTNGALTRPANLGTLTANPKFEVAAQEVERPAKNSFSERHATGLGILLLGLLAILGAWTWRLMREPGSST